MRKLFFVLFAILSVKAFAQIPSNYYNSAIGLSGYTLKSQLKSIITNGHANQGYDALYYGYQTTDRDYYYENDGSVLDIYSENPDGTDAYNYQHNSSDQCGQYNSENDCYNREHVVPQSVFNEQSPMVADIHTVIPTDGYVNNRRSNYPYGEVNNPSWTSLNGSKLGNNSTTGYSGTVFEPIDEFKGDVARMLFYFATRYETQVDSWSFDMFNGTEDKVFTDWALNMLLEWHQNDPVNQREIDRNNAAYDYQGNANPFISHPEWVALIWNPTPDTQAPSVPTNLTVSNATATSLYLTWTASTDNVGVVSYDIYKDGSLVGNSTTNNFSVNGLSPLTTYSFFVKAKDAAGNVSSESNTVQGTTTDVPASSNELFFSEYIEGSSQNKALEIVNLTPNAIDLSNYTLAKNINGAGGWESSPFALSGTLNTGQVYVIAHSQADAAILSHATATSSTFPTFNGNDAIGLFKNGVLIDIIGVLNGGTADFAKDVTLRRKSSIVNPNTTFNLVAEWDVFPMNTFDNIGIYSTLSNDDVQNEPSILVFPNPTKNVINLKFNSQNETANYMIFDVSGKVIDANCLILNTINVEHLSNGLYFLRIIDGKKVYSSKFVIQK